MAAVLVVDDDATVREVVITYLTKAGHSVTSAADGVAALDSVATSPPELVVLDLMLPGVDGLEVCRRLRATSDVPVIMLTAKGSVNDRVVGLELGADDYVTKPFSPRELVLRVESVLRRTQEPVPVGGPVRSGDVLVDPGSRVVTVEQDRVAMTAREFDLLHHFVSHAGTVFSREDLLRDVWGWSFGDDSTVTVHVRRLREKLETDPTHPTRLVTVWGVGYRWEEEVMTHDEVVIVAIAAGCAASVGLLGLLVAWVFRGSSLRWLPAGVSVVAATAVIAAVIGTAHAMFISGHDYVVVLWVCLVAGIVSACFASLVGAVVVRSSRQLHEGARRFGESGQYDAEVTGPAEFTALNEELRETSRKLTEAREREQRLEESRRELVSWVSHDLRTPLAGLQAMTEALEDGMVDDPSRYHRQISAEVTRTVRMVDDLFELSQIHAGLLDPSPQTVALGDLVSESLAAAESVAAVKGIRLDGQVDADVLVHVDPHAMSRVIGNLLMNAIRHTPSDGAVQIRGWSRPDGVELSVRDGCGGIPGDEIDRVFDVAFRGGSARTPGPEPVVSGSGAGLGLAIVRGLIEVHRGHVAVENVEDGCRFVVTIPTSDPAAGSTDPVPAPAL